MRISMMGLSVVGLAVLPLAAACGSGSGASNGTPEGGSESGTVKPDSGSDSGKKHADAGADTGMADAKADVDCGGSVVPANVTSNLTLTLACSPWHVQAQGTIVGGSASPVLTIDAGVKVIFDTGAFLSVGVGDPGGIVAVGTSASGITFTSGAATPAPGDWASVAIGDSALSTSKIGYATFEYGGAPNMDGYSYAMTPGTLMVYSASTLSVPLDHLTLSHNLSNGIALDGMQVGYGTGSGQLIVEDWGNGDAPFVISADSASTLPTTLMGTGGVVDIICGNNCTPGTGGQSIVDVTQKWPVIPIPYLIDGMGLQIEGAGSSHATLTIDGPNTLQFLSGGTLVVDPNGIDQADLVAKQVTFTSNNPAPSAGDWGGIEFVVLAGGLPNSSLVDCTIDWAGDLWTYGCTPPATGAVWVNGPLGNAPAVGPAITGCTFSNYPADNYGIITSTISTTYTTGNTFGTPANSVSGC